MARLHREVQGGRGVLVSPARSYVCGDSSPKDPALEELSEAEIDTMLGLAPPPPPAGSLRDDDSEEAAWAAAKTRMHSRVGERRAPGPRWNGGRK